MGLEVIRRLRRLRNLHVTSELLLTILAPQRGRHRPGVQPTLVQVTDITNAHQRFCSPTARPFRDLKWVSAITAEVCVGRYITAQHVSCALTAMPSIVLGVGCSCLRCQRRYRLYEPRLALSVGVAQVVSLHLKTHQRNVGTDVSLMGRDIVVG